VKSRDRLQDGTLRLLLSSRGSGLSFCEAHARSGVSCREVRLPLSPGTMALVPGSEPASVTGSERAHDERRSYDVANGEPVKLHGGKARGFVLARDGDGQPSLAFVEDGEAGKKRAVELPDGAMGPWIVADQLVWVHEGALFARALGDDGKLGRKEKVGTVAHTPPRVCRSGAAAALLFGDGPNEWTMAFYDGSSWQAAARGEERPQPKPEPVAAPEPEPSDPAPASPDPAIAKRAALRDAQEFGMIGLLNSGAGGDPDAPTAPWGREAGDPDADPYGGFRGLVAGSNDETIPRRPFVCTAGEGVVTWRESNRREEAIHELRCTPSGCRRGVASLPGFEAREWWITTALGERTLVVWRRPQGDLRMRLAPLADLARGADVILMDGHDHGGVSTVDLQALVDAEAVLFLFRGLGWHGLRIAADGSYAPVD
jgi:hypothetical protein